MLGDVDWGRPGKPLALLAALHYLVLDGRASWSGVRAALRDWGSFIRDFVREQRVQTNEVQRSWMLLPCFLEVARRTRALEFDLIELGPSAGLNLVWDRYRYVYEQGVWGSVDAPLELAGVERRPVPHHLLELAPRVRSRVGVDRSPVEVTTDEGARLLKSFVWPDQPWRLEQLDQAIAALREDPPELRSGDAAEELPRLLQESRASSLTIVYHTAVLEYLSAEERASVLESLRRTGAARPLAFVGTGPPRDGADTYYGMVVQIWPGGDREIAAHADFHGAWIEWLR